MKVLVIIPCFNEAASIRKVIYGLKASSLQVDILVVDDGSKDNTFEAASSLAPCVRHSSNLGIGGAVQTGIRFAHRHGYDYAAQMDGDGQHPPSELGLLIEKATQSDAAITVGSRFLTSADFQSTFLRRQGIRLIRSAIQILFGQRITDPTSGYRVWNKQAIALFAREYPRDYPEPISNAIALSRGLKVQEVPVNMSERTGGKSSILGFKQATYMFRVLGYILLVRFARRI